MHTWLVHKLYEGLLPCRVALLLCCICAGCSGCCGRFKHLLELSKTIYYSTKIGNGLKLQHSASLFRLAKPTQPEMPKTMSGFVLRILLPLSVETNSADLCGCQKPGNVCVTGMHCSIPKAASQFWKLPFVQLCAIQNCTNKTNRACVLVLCGSLRCLMQGVHCQTAADLVDNQRHI